MFRTFYIGDSRFIGGDKPSIADIRLADTLEFLASIDYPPPGMGKGLHDGNGDDAWEGLLRTGWGRTGGTSHT